MSARKFYRDKNGRFAKTPGRAHAVAGVRRAGARRGWGAGLGVGTHGPQLTVSKTIFEGRRANVSAHASVGRAATKRRRIRLSGGITGSIDI